MHDLVPFAQNVFAHHLSWVGGLLTVLGVGELMLGKKILLPPKWVLGLGIAFLFFACCQAWFDEHRNVQSLISDKAALSARVALLQAQNEFKDRPIILQIPQATSRRHTNATPPKPATQQSNSGGINVQQSTAGKNSPIVNSPVTVNPDVNPLAPVVIYYFNGDKKVIKEGGTNVSLIPGDQQVSFNKMVELQSTHDWNGLKTFCESQMQMTPEWLTPILFAGVAYANLGNKQKAIELLTKVVGRAAGDTAYQDASRILEILKQNNP